MSDKGKISVVVLGTEVHLKKSLISLILGKDAFAHRSSDVKTENEAYITITPTLYEESEDIRKLWSSKHPDMCLLVVEDGFTTEQVLQQIGKLHEITGIPTEEFIVVLPLRCKPEESYSFKFYTLDDLFNKLRKLTEDRNLMLTNKRSDKTHPETSSTESFTDNKKTLKGNHSGTKVNLVLLGMSGTGKSASGNTILGKRKFESEASSVPVTTECQAAETEIKGTRVRVIDTPDMFDDKIKSSVKKHVEKCKELCQSDPCVYLLVMEVGRFTDGERDILRKVEEAFGRRAKEQTIILFTRGKDLQHDEMSFEYFLQDCESELQNIVEQCGRRCVLFENKPSHQHQVTKLMQAVNMMLDKQQKH